MSKVLPDRAQEFGGNSQVRSDLCIGQPVSKVGVLFQKKFIPFFGCRTYILQYPVLQFDVLLLDNNAEVAVKFMIAGV